MSTLSLKEKSYLNTTADKRKIKMDFLNEIRAQPNSDYGSETCSVDLNSQLEVGSDRSSSGFGSDESSIGYGSENQNHDPTPPSNLEIDETFSWNHGDQILLTRDNPSSSFHSGDYVLLSHPNCDNLETKVEKLSVLSVSETLKNGWKRLAIRRRTGNFNIFIFL